MNHAYLTAKRRPLRDGGFEADDGYVYNIGQDGKLWKRRLGLFVWTPAPNFDLDGAFLKAVDDLLSQHTIITIAECDELEAVYA